MKKGLLNTVFLTAMTGAALLIPANIAQADQAVAHSAAGLTQFRVQYTGSLFVFPLGELTVAGSKNSVGYAMRADMQTAGFGKLSKDGGLWSTTTGYFNADKVQPKNHVIQKLNKKNRRIEMKYDGEGNPTASIVPRFGSMGVPAASDAERREAVDAMSGIMQLMLTGHKYADAPCTGVIPVFDGKQRYNLRLKPAGTKKLSQRSYRGKTVRCHIFMDTVSGYDAEDLLTEEEASTPLEVYMANYEDAGMWIPVRFDYRISGIKVNIKATDIYVTTGS